MTAAWPTTVTAFARVVFHYGQPFFDFTNGAGEDRAVQALIFLARIMQRTDRCAGGVVTFT
jgi:hypothetical protein